MLLLELFPLADSGYGRGFADVFVLLLARVKFLVDLRPYLGRRRPLLDKYLYLAGVRYQTTNFVLAFLLLAHGGKTVQHDYAVFFYAGQQLSPASADFLDRGVYYVGNILLADERLLPIILYLYPYTIISVGNKRLRLAIVLVFRNFVVRNTALKFYAYRLLIPYFNTRLLYVGEIGLHDSPDLSLDLIGIYLAHKSLCGLLQVYRIYSSAA